MRVKNYKYLAVLIMYRNLNISHRFTQSTRSVTLSETKGLVFNTEILRLCLRMTFCCVHLWFNLTFSDAGPLSGKIIVIDPGHGTKNATGKIVNYGCRSASGAKEMDVVVDISEILGGLFLQEGATVYFTRDKKNYWRSAESQDADNQSRAEFANSKNAALFLRIHCNWSPSKKKRGVSVLWYKDNSRKIAETVYEEISAICGKSGVIIDGIKKQHLVGFEFAEVPSILIEYGYLSNKEDEKLLKDKKYIRKVSETVVEGLKKHFSEEKNAREWK